MPSTSTRTGAAGSAQKGDTSAPWKCRPISWRRAFLPSRLSWSTASGADYYDVARGSLSGLPDRSYGDCLRDDLAATGTTDADIPDPGSRGFAIDVAHDDQPLRIFVVTATQRVHEDMTNLLERFRMMD